MVLSKQEEKILLNYFMKNFDTKTTKKESYRLISFINIYRKDA
jgi:hypothetical protein